MGHYVSFVIHSWQDGDEGTMRWSVRGVNDAVPTLLPDGAFVVRTWVDDEQIVRGLIRHVQSGREMQFQSGQNALEFVRSWFENAAPVDGADDCPLGPGLDPDADPVDAGLAPGEGAAHG